MWQMLTGAAHDPQLTEAYRLLLTRVRVVWQSELLSSIINIGKLFGDGEVSEHVVAQLPTLL